MFTINAHGEIDLIFLPLVARTPLKPKIDQRLKGLRSHLLSVDPFCIQRDMNARAFCCCCVLSEKVAAVLLIPPFLQLSLALTDCLSTLQARRLYKEQEGPEGGKEGGRGMGRKSLQ